jgi:hypothetical protein
MLPVSFFIKNSDNINLILQFGYLIENDIVFNRAPSYPLCFVFRFGKHILTFLWVYVKCGIIIINVLIYNDSIWWIRRVSGLCYIKAYE